MIKLLKKISKRTKAPRVFSVPENTRVYCVGDIHGREDLLMDLHKMILQDSSKFLGDKVVVYLGDYIDRGLHSKEVVDLLLNKPLVNFKPIYLRGNHEQVLLDFLNVDANIAMEWFNFGGQSTLLSYGVSITGVSFGDKLNLLQQDLADKIPAEHLSFYTQLNYSYECGDYFFVHAGVKPKKALKRQSELDMMWIRNEFLASNFQFKKMIVHGHSIVDQPEQKDNRIAIDTGAYNSGRLTCLVLEGEQRRFIQTGGKGSL